jgi:DNA repair protein RecN (Recombination protein N)
MLKSLVISNYALIDQLEIDFSEGFSVITGETGAGKSIILGALSLVLGQRSDTSALKDKEKKSVIEAEFNIAEYGFEQLFEEGDVDYFEDTTIRREILSSGKSRAFVNDTPVNLGFLKKIADGLIDIHSQHQNLLLGESYFQQKVVDTVAQNEGLIADYKSIYSRYKLLLKEKSVLEKENAALKDEADYMLFQYKQLEELKLSVGEQGELEQEREVLSHAEEIKGGLFSVVQSFNGESISVLAELKEVSRNLDRISAFLPMAEEWNKRAESAYFELEDLQSELERKIDTIDHDPERLLWVNERLDQIYSLQQKHHVEDVASLLQIQHELAEKLEKVSSFDVDLEEKQKQIDETFDDLKQAAKVLTQSRKKVLKGIEDTLVAQLVELGMPNVVLKVACNPLNEFSENGADEINFLFSANKNGQLAAIPKVASGGEMSRVMLCIKSLLSLSKGLPTIIFDEIDTGVSGEVADKMGRIMQAISENIQVISITHLPQIAVKGKQHYKVYKTDNEIETQTCITKLTNEHRIKEIAKMLSGSDLTEAALTNAKALLEASA